MAAVGSDESDSRQISKAGPIGFPDGLDALHVIMNREGL